VSNTPALGPGAERKTYLSWRRLFATWDLFRSDPKAWRLPALLARGRDLAERYANWHFVEEDDEQATDDA
jgi:hypothetical protein